MNNISEWFSQRWEQMKASHRQLKRESTKAGKLAKKAEDDRMLALVRLVGGYQTNVQFHHSTNLDAFTGKTKQHIKSPKNLSGHNVRRVL